MPNEQRPQAPRLIYLRPDSAVQARCADLSLP